MKPNPFILMFVAVFPGAGIQAQEESTTPVQFPSNPVANRMLVDEDISVVADSLAEAVAQAKRLLAQSDSTDRLFSPEKHEQTFGFLDQAIQKFADAPERHKLLALRAEARDFTHEERRMAIEDLSAAIALCPDCVDYLRARAIRWPEDEKEKAVADAARALRLKPENTAIVVELALALTSADCPEEALGMLNYAAALHPEDGLISSELVDAYHKLQRDEEALAESDRGLTLKDISPQTYVHRAVVLQSLGRNRDVLRTLEKARDLWPESERIAENLESGREAYLDRLPILKDAASPGVKLFRLNSLIQSDPDPLHFYQRGLLLQELGRWEEAVDFFAAASAELPEFQNCQLAHLRTTRLLEGLRSSGETALPDGPESPPLSRDEQILEAIKTGNSKPLLEQMSPDLLRYIDREELQRRMKRLSRHWPPLLEARVADISNHADVGTLQKRAILVFPNNDEGLREATVTIAWTRNGSFLGFEFASERLKLGSLTALKIDPSIPEQVEQHVRAFSENDREKLRQLERESGDYPKQFLEIAHPILRDLKQLEHLDTVIELPEYSEDDLSISHLLLCESSDGTYVLCQGRYHVGPSLEMKQLQLGNNINLHYSTRLQANDAHFARAIASGDISDFYELVHPSMHDEIVNRELYQLLSSAMERSMGKFHRLIPDSGSSLVRIKAGEPSRESSFDAEYEHSLAVIKSNWSYQTLDKFNYLPATGMTPIKGDESIGAWLVPIAESDVKQYVSGSAESALAMLQSYPGYEAESVESMARVARKINDRYGALLSCQYREAAYEPKTHRWTVSFLLKFEKKESIGRAVYGIKDVAPDLYSVGFD